MICLSDMLKLLIYQAVAENMASEQSARMVAISLLPTTRKPLSGELKLVYINYPSGSYYQRTGGNRQWCCCSLTRRFYFLGI